jgi:hypothetical protein
MCFQLLPRLARHPHSQVVHHRPLGTPPDTSACTTPTAAAAACPEPGHTLGAAAVHASRCTLRGRCTDASSSASSTSSTAGGQTLQGLRPEPHKQRVLVRGPVRTLSCMQPLLC